VTNWLAGSEPATAPGKLDVALGDELVLHVWLHLIWKLV